MIHLKKIMKRGSLSHQLSSRKSPEKRLLMGTKKKKVICKVDYTMYESKCLEHVE